MATVLVIVSIVEVICPELFPLSMDKIIKLGLGADDREDEIGKQMRQILEASTSDIGEVSRALLDGFHFCSKMDKKHPLVCRNLELGSDWVAVSSKMLGVQWTPPESVTAC